MRTRRQLLGLVGRCSGVGTAVALAGCSGDGGGGSSSSDGIRNNVGPSGAPDIQFETEFTGGNGADDFAGDPDAGCGILHVYTAGGTDSVGTDRIDIVGSSQHPDGALWATSAHYNINEEISPEEREDSAAIRVSSGDEIRIVWITEDEERATIANLGSMDRYC